MRQDAWGKFQYEAWTQTSQQPARPPVLKALVVLKAHFGLILRQRQRPSHLGVSKARRGSLGVLTIGGRLRAGKFTLR